MLICAWTITLSITLSEEFTIDDFFKSRVEDVDVFLIKKPDGALEFVQPGSVTKIEKGTLLSFSAKTDGIKTDASETPRSAQSSSKGLAGPANPLPG